MLAILGALSIADIATTVLALNQGLTEANPIARNLFGFLGVIPAAILLKLIGLMPFVYLLLHYPAWWPVAAAYCLLLALVVVNNILELSDRS